MSGTYLQKRSYPDPLTYSANYRSKSSNQLIDSTRYSRKASDSTWPLDSQETKSFRTKSPSGDHDILYDKTGFFDKESTYDTGHDFYTERRKVYLKPLDGRWVSDGSVIYPPYLYDGYAAINPYVSTLPSGSQLFVPPSTTNMTYYGTKAIAETIPTNPESGIATFIGELREGLPSMIGASVLESRARDFRKLGGEYLNVQFGWLPFISDIQKLCEAIQKSDKILNQYRRDSGRLVRRQKKFPRIDTIKMVQETSFSNSQHLITLNVGSSSATNQRPVRASGKFQETLMTSESIWFSGAYTYLLNEDDSFFGRLEQYSQLANKLGGTRITPSVLWELAPWSWLADWNANIGVNIHNFTAFHSDNLALKYGYLMRKSRTLHTFTSTVTNKSVSSGPGYNDLQTVPAGGVSTLAYELIRKERVKSAPYGFALKPSDYSDRQWAVLAALGLSKAPKTLF